MRNFLDLTGRVALVTGASSGIGAASARILADLGARVAIGYHGNEAGAHAIRGAIQATGGLAVAVKADVRKTIEVRQMISHVTTELGPIDILVNNAGSLVKRMGLLELDEAIWDDIFSLNLKSAAFCTQAVAPSMVERGRGAIINV